MQTTPDPLLSDCLENTREGKTGYNEMYKAKDLEEIIRTLLNILCRALDTLKGN
jgi:hypothetical protein